MPKLTTNGSSPIWGRPFNSLVLVDVAAGAIAVSVAQEHSGEIHWSADSRSFDVVYDRRGYREETDSSGRPLLFNMYPTVRNWKVAELRRK